jgi:S1-C subfamily serine protease
MLTLAVACCSVTRNGINSWVGVDARIGTSLQRLTTSFPDKDGKPRPAFCSAFVIDRENGYALTAAHCVVGVDGPIYLNDHLAAVEKVDQSLDLAVLQSSQLRVGEDVRFRTTHLRIGEDVAYAGFGFGTKAPLVTFGHIASLGEAELISYQGPERVRGLLLDGTIMPGLSGGAVIDRDGYVVSVVLGVYRGNVGEIGIGVAPADLLAFTAFYRE